MQKPRRILSMNPIQVTYPPSLKAPSQPHRNSNTSCDSSPLISLFLFYKVVNI